MNRYVCLLAAGLLLPLSGCGGYDAEVTGTVTLDGAPLDRGAVSFHPIDEGPVVVGYIQPDGRYRIKTGAVQGLPAGEYVVTVVATENPPPAALDETPTPGRLLTPQRYGDRDTTPLKASVAPGRGTHDFQLTGDE